MADSADRLFYLTSWRSRRVDGVLGGRAEVVERRATVREDVFYEMTWRCIENATYPGSYDVHLTLDDGHGATRRYDPDALADYDVMGPVFDFGPWPCTVTYGSRPIGKMYYNPRSAGRFSLLKWIGQAPKREVYARIPGKNGRCYESFLTLREDHAGETAEFVAFCVSMRVYWLVVEAGGF